MRKKLQEVVGGIGNLSLKALFGESLQLGENLGESDSEEDVSIQNAVMMMQGLPKPEMFSGFRGR